jgi:hypothetical protein
MNLQSARDLKQELRAFVEQDLLARGGLETETVDSRRVTLGTIRDLAFGLAPKKLRDDYQIAVRAISEEDVPQRWIEAFRNKTKREIDIRYTGAIIARPAFDRALSIHCWNSRIFCASHARRRHRHRF